MSNFVKRCGRVIEINNIVSNIYMLNIESDKNLPKFLPGQFLHLSIDHFDPSEGFWPESRVFSITTVDYQQNTIQILFSVIGVYTKRMSQELKIGSRVWIKLPYGDFIINNYVEKDEKVVLIAGGTGISPYIPFLDSVECASNIELCYGVRSFMNIIFYDRFKIYQAEKKLNVIIYIENFNENDSNEGFFKGRIDIHSIIMRNGRNAKYFLSGPPNMIYNFRDELMNNQITNIYIDNWS